MNFPKLMAAVLLSVVVGCAFGAAKDGGSDGFKPLFNGKDLSGWIYGGTPEKSAKIGAGYKVEEGTVYCTATDAGQIFTEKEYGDFVLRFEFKLETNSNNGIAIRSPLEGDPAYVGMEIQVLDDAGPKHAKLRPEQAHGSVYDLVAAEKGHQKPVGEWNQEEIRVEGTKVKVTLNDKVIVDTDLADIKDEGKRARHPGLARKSGHIGLLGHGSRVDFRNMMIKEL